MKKSMLYAWLLSVNLYISAFTFGGGYVVIPMIRKLFIEKKRLMDEGTLMDMAAVAQSSPGAIAINLTALTGYHVAGVPGAVISCIAAVIPPIAILSVVSIFYASFRDNRLISAILTGMEAGVAAIVLDTVIDMCKTIMRKKQWFASMLLPAVFIASFCFQISVAVILIVCVLLTLLEMRVTLFRRAYHADHI